MRAIMQYTPAAPGNIVIRALLLSFFFPVACFSQEMLVSGEASMPMTNPKITKMQYEYETYQMAVNQSIDQAFGSSVVSNYERLTSTEMEGRSLKSHFDIRSNYLNTYPNGIWVQDKSRECFEQKDLNGKWWMTCKVTGIARKLDAANVRFVAKTLDGTNLSTDHAETFITSESGYLYFKSAEDGYIIVFYDDMNNVQRCIPYNKMTETCLKVKANTDYLFFSEDHASYLDSSSLVDEIEFYAESPLDYNQFYILFSPKPFSGYLLEPLKNLGDDYTSFKSMSREYFHSWLQENRIRNKDLQVQILGVMIRGE